MLFSWEDSTSKHNMHVMEKIEKKSPKISLNIIEPRYLELAYFELLLISK